MERGSTIGLLGVQGTKSPRYIIDNLEEETEEINRMEPEAPQSVCNSYSNLKIYKDWVDWTGDLYG